MLAVDAFEFFCGAVLVACGAPFVVFAGSIIVSNLKMRSRATGTIVGIACGGDDAAHPVVEFRTQDNTRARFTDDAWFTSDAVVREPPIGRSVRVRYDARDHRHARVATFFGSWCDALLLLLVGGVPFVLGLLGMAGFLLVGGVPFVLGLLGMAGFGE